jgi:hypothetical protein
VLFWPSIWAIAAGATNAACAQLPTGPQDAPSATSLTDRDQRHLDVFGPVVLNPSDSIDAKTRTAAATELLEMHREQANAILLQGLRSGEAVVVQAILAALTASDETPSALLPGLLEAMATVEDDVLALLQAELVRYGEPANAELALMARDTSLPVDHRLRCVNAMGAFRSRDGAGRLMELLDAQRDDSGPFTDAVCDSLAELSGFSLERDAQAWRQWWASARNLPRSEWLEQQLRQEIARIGTLEHEVQLEKARVDRLSRELVEAHRELFRQPSFTVQQQLQKLPGLLASDLAPVRSFAIVRIGILLQDSVPLPAAVQEGLLACAADPDPDIRIEALTKLEEMSHPQLLTLVAESLAKERDGRVVSHMLKYLSRRPTEDALPALAAQLRDPGVGPLAADALWALSINLDPQKLSADELMDSLRQAHAVNPQPAFARLFALLASDDVASSLVPMLDGDDEAMKGAVAAGFARRGRIQPLLDRVEDVTVYPYVTEAMLRGQMDLPRFEQLLALTPPPVHVEAWRSAVLRMAGRLPASNWPRVDDLLRRLDPNESILRRQFLEQATNSTAIDESPQLRTTMTDRLATLLLNADEPAEALRVLDANGNSSLRDASTNELRFEAAVRTGRWELAAQLFEDAPPWIRLLERLAPGQPVAARLLRDEIMRRFGDVLQGELLTRFEDAVRLIPPLDASQTSTAEAAPIEGES